MNSYNNKNHNNSINNNYNKTNSTKSGFDLIVISLVLRTVSLRISSALTFSYLSNPQILPSLPMFDF